jgi:hypothetical protein
LKPVEHDAVQATNPTREPTGVFRNVDRSMRPLIQTLTDKPRRTPLRSLEDDDLANHGSHGENQNAGDPHGWIRDLRHRHHVQLSVE